MVERRALGPQSSADVQPRRPREYRRLRRMVRSTAGRAALRTRAIFSALGVAAAVAAFRLTAEGLAEAWIATMAVVLVVGTLAGVELALQRAREERQRAAARTRRNLAAIVAFPAPVHRAATAAPPAPIKQTVDLQPAPWLVNWVGTEWARTALGGAAFVQQNPEQFAAVGLALGEALVSHLPESTILPRSEAKSILRTLARRFVERQRSTDALGTAGAPLAPLALPRESAITTAAALHPPQNAPVAVAVKRRGRRGRAKAESAL